MGKRLLLLLAVDKNRYTPAHTKFGPSRKRAGEINDGPFDFLLLSFSKSKVTSLPLFYWWNYRQINVIGCNRAQTVRSGSASSFRDREIGLKYRPFNRPQQCLIYFELDKTEKNGPTIFHWFIAGFFGVMSRNCALTSDTPRLLFRVCSPLFLFGPFFNCFFLSWFVYLLSLSLVCLLTESAEEFNQVPNNINKCLLVKDGHKRERTMEKRTGGVRRCRGVGEWKMEWGTALDWRPRQPPTERLFPSV